MKMVSDHDWDRSRKVTDLKLDTFAVAIDLIRIEWLNRMERMALAISVERSSPDRKILDLLPDEEDIQHENIRRLRFWYEEFLRAYEELKAIKEKREAQ